MSRKTRTALIRKLASDQIATLESDQPPVPVEQLMQGAGLAIGEAKSLPAGSGFFDQRNYAVRLSADLYRETPGNRHRRCFTLAHELGHCLLDHSEHSCWDVGLTGENAEPRAFEDLPDFEAEAHEFARELLLPRRWLARDWKANADAKNWGFVYSVAPATFFIVLGERRLLTPPRRKR